MTIKIRNASVTLGVNTILEEVNLDINDKDKIAIVGRNGAGKTTLLKAIIDNSLFTKGIGEDKFSITKMGSYKIGYLKQITFSNEEATLQEEILKVYSNLKEIQNKLNNLLQEMECNNNSKTILEYTETLEHFKIMGGYSYQEEYEAMLAKFGFTVNDKNKKIKDFSGGERTKIAFIKLLLSKPDLLILDEPTNHLDIKTIEYLESYLKNYPKAIVLVSHDRMFLDNIVSTVYEIDYGRTIKYKGNYSYYEKEKNIRYEKALKDYELEQKEIKRLQNIYERFKSKPTKAKMALSKLKQIERMDLLEKPNPKDLKTFKTNLKEITNTGKIVMNLKDLEFGYDKTLGKINLEIVRGQKIGIIGENGIGKSTFLKTLAGLIKPISGELNYGVNLKIGYFDQNLAMQNNDNTVLDEFRNYIPHLGLEEARSILGSFLFKGDDVYKKLNVLSGGEIVRLQLCKIFYNKPNVLILDEPTNHMDIIGKETLENILASFPGTLIFVSHDRYFVKKLATELLVFNANNIDHYRYGYLEYEEKRKDIIESQNVLKETKMPKKEVVNKYNLNKEIKVVEREITKLEQELKKLNAELFQEDVYNDVNKLEVINNKISILEQKLNDFNNKWEELINKVEEN